MCSLDLAELERDRANARELHSRRASLVASLYPAVTRDYHAAEDAVSGAIATYLERRCLYPWKEIRNPFGWVRLEARHQLYEDLAWLNGHSTSSDDDEWPEAKRWPRPSTWRCGCWRLNRALFRRLLTPGERRALWEATRELDFAHGSRVRMRPAVRRTLLCRARKMLALHRDEIFVHVSGVSPALCKEGLCPPLAQVGRLAA